MRNPFIHGVGGVVSADIAVPDHERELEFYSNILTTGDSPLWREDLMNNLGTPIMGLGNRTPEYEHLPLQWMPHFQVADVAASAKTAIEFGGKKLIESQGDSECQWAVLTDPAGAAFGIIPAVADTPDNPAQQNERRGHIAWLALFVPDAPPICEFYQRTVGWNPRPTESTDGEGQGGEKFEMLIDENTVAAEICQFIKEQTDIPPVWLIHLPVDDLNESLRRVQQGGGEVIHEDVNQKSAIIRDPVGVFLALQSD